MQDPVNNSNDVANNEVMEESKMIGALHDKNKTSDKTTKQSVQMQKLRKPIHMASDQMSRQKVYESKTLKKNY